MGLGERCDEIVRLIDETLAGLGVDPDALSADARGSGGDRGHPPRPGVGPGPGRGRLLTPAGHAPLH